MIYPASLVGIVLMSSDDGVYQSTSNRRRRLHRARLGVVVTGLAALLGAGSYLITAQIMDRRNHAVTGDVGALAPMVTPAPAPWTPMPRSPRPAHSTKNAVRQALSPTPPPTPPPSVPPAVLPTTSGVAVAAAGGPVQDRSEKTPTGTLRVVTARFDLTGQRVLAWAADRGRAVTQQVRCTQNLKPTGSGTPPARPAVLLCWRTSPTRSVVTLLTDRAGHPSTARSVQVIDQEWARLS
jgi:hypothetical protein